MIMSVTTEHVNSVDSYFLSQVNDFIAKEIATIDIDDRAGRFFVYETALQMISNQCPTMTSILCMIDDCYKNVIDLNINKAKSSIGKEAVLSRVINCQASIKHQEKRVAVLRQHLEEQEREKEILANRCAELDRQIEERRKLYYPEPKKPKVVDETEMKYFQLTAIDDEDIATNEETLQKRLAELDTLIESTANSSKKLWIPIADYQKLEEKMQKLTSKRIELAQNCSTLYLRHERLRYAVTALRDVVSDASRVATVGEALLRTFKTFKPDKKESFIEFLISLSEQANNYQGDNIGGGSKDTIAPDVDMSLAEWLKKTHQLLSNGEFKEAAETAASAPNGVLCNLATLEAFRSALPDGIVASVKEFEYNVPVLFYLEAVLGHLTAGYALSEKFVAACVNVAIEYNCYWLLSSWVAKRRLPLVVDVIKIFLKTQHPHYLPLGESLCRAALFEYPHSKDFAILLLECLLMQQRVSSAIIAIRQYNLSSEDCAVALLKHSASKLLNELAKQSGKDLDSLLAILESFPSAIISLKNDASISHFAELDGSTVIDDDLLSFLQKAKRHYPETLPRLQSLCQNLSDCGLANISTRLQIAC